MSRDYLGDRDSRKSNPFHDSSVKENLYFCARLPDFSQSILFVFYLLFDLFLLIIVLVTSLVQRFRAKLKSDFDSNPYAPYPFLKFFIWGHTSLAKRMVCISENSAGLISPLFAFVTRGFVIVTQYDYHHSCFRRFPCP